MPSLGLSPRFNAWESEPDSDNEDAKPVPPPAVLCENAAKAVRQLVERTTPIHHEWLRRTWRELQDSKHNLSFEDKDCTWQNAGALLMTDD